MKYVWILISMLVCGAAFGGVEVKDGMVTAELQAEPLKEVLDTLSEQAGLDISLDSSAAGEMVYAKFENLPIGAAIRKLLEGTDINYALIAGIDGAPTSLFVSKSETLGAPPKKLDTRPVTSSPNRGVVTPVQPMPPQPVVQQPGIQQPGNQPGNPVRDEKGNAMQPKPNTPFGGNNTVPTGGSLNPNPIPNPQNPNQPGTRQDKPDMQNVVGEDGEEEEEDDDDEDDE